MTTRRATDLYQHVTDRIVAAIENGAKAGDWKMPWHVEAGADSPLPYNIVGKRSCRGINTLGLRAAAVPEAERNAAAEVWFANLGMTLRSGGDRAGYVASQDVVFMPDFGAFATPVHYYSALAHEATHWTGHASRCDRDMMARFGDASYAMEELVAELGAAFVCAILGLDSEPRADHAQYVANWLGKLCDDKRAIFTAASAAQKAVDYMLAKQPTAAEHDVEYDEAA